MADRPRYRHRDPRPRYYDDDDESDTSPNDAYPPPRARQSRRSAPPQQQVRRPSILVDPEETPSERAARRRPRANSNVRLQTSDDEYDEPRSRRGPPRGARHDLEAKDGDQHRQFRAKRDGYESDEGENLRQARRAPPPPAPIPYDNGDGYDKYRQSEKALPLRGKPRAPLDEVEYGGGPVEVEPGLRRRRTYKDPSPRDRQGYEDYDPSPRRRRPDYDDPGYRSDGARGPRAPRPRARGDYDDYDDYERPVRRRDDGYRSGGERLAPRPRPQDYYSDYREDRAPRRGDPRRSPRDERYYDDRAPRRGDDYDRPRSSKRDGGKRSWQKDLQKEASAAFMTYALPMIKKEGTKYVKKELQKYMAGRGGNGA